MSNNEYNVGEDEDNQDNVLDESAKDQSIAPTQYDITSFGADYDVEGLVKRLNRQDIIIPKFQRNYIWTQREASRFIESLLLGLPVPAIFLVREKETNKLSVIDGQQRLKTLQFFYNGFFNPKDDEEKKQVFKLIQVQPKFEGLTYEALGQQDKTKLNDSLMHAIIIKQESPKDDDTSIYHIFDRLNSEGRRLTPQEIRTAVYHGEFIEAIKRFNNYKNWRAIFGKKSARLKDQELILRFLAMYHDGQQYERPMNEFVNKFAERHRHPDSKFLSNSEILFKSSIDTVFQSIGLKAFRPTSSINAAVFDSVMVGIARRLVKGPIVNYKGVTKAYKDLLEDKDYLSLISNSTSDKNNVESRLDKATKKFAGV